MFNSGQEFCAGVKPETAEVRVGPAGASEPHE